MGEANFYYFTCLKYIVTFCRDLKPRQRRQQLNQSCLSRKISLTLPSKRRKENASSRDSCSRLTLTSWTLSAPVVTRSRRCSVTLRRWWFAPDVLPCSVSQRVAKLDLRKAAPSAGSNIKTLSTQFWSGPSCLFHPLSTPHLNIHVAEVDVDAATFVNIIWFAANLSRCRLNSILFLAFVCFT